MKKSLIFLSLFAVTIAGSFFLKAKEPPAIVIIGAGPAGLGAAIEARQMGANVTLVEKRDSYTRERGLFLYDPAIKILEKWQAVIPQMSVSDIGEGKKIGFVEIKYLEEGLANKAKELGIEKFQGEFTGFNKKTAVIATSDKEIYLPYDILVGADGAHSAVRNTLGIEPNHLGSAKGAGAFIPLVSKEIFHLSEIIKKDNHFIRKITFPLATMMFLQTSFPENKWNGKSKLEDLAKEISWQEESNVIAEGKAYILDNVEVLLQQVPRFSDKKKNVILIGESAASASFFQGKGANTALLCTQIAGSFFKKMQEDKKSAYASFEHEMKVATDAMIEDSKFLFVN